jgi:peptide/nickel transport system permease protein
MLKFIIRRLIQAIFVIIGVSFVTFMLLHLNGDPVNLLVPIDAGPQVRAETRAALGLDKPFKEQYFRFMAGVWHFDFGNSIFYSGQTAIDVVWSSLPNTIILAATAFIMAILISFPVGILSAIKRNSWIDRVGMVIALIGQSIPVFILGTVFIWVFAVKLNWLPADGMRDSRGEGANNFWDLPSHLLLPGLSLALFATARQVRLVRSSMIEVLSQDYIRTAHSKGLWNFLIIRRHALKNAMIPIITVLGLDIATLLSGAVITENIFSWPGIGRAAVNAINQNDFPVVQATVFVVALGYVVINLMVDVLYAYLNPKIRYQ